MTVTKLVIRSEAGTWADHFVWGKSVPMLEELATSLKGFFAQTPAASGTVLQLAKDPIPALEIHPEALEEGDGVMKNYPGNREGVVVTVGSVGVIFNEEYSDEDIRSVMDKVGSDKSMSKYHGLAWRYFDPKDYN